MRQGTMLLKRCYCTAEGAAAKAKTGQNLVEKIVQLFAVDGEGQPVKDVVRSGDFVSIKPHRVMTHDNTAAVIPKFESLGATKHFDPHQAFIGLDHDVQNKSEANVAKYKKVQKFAEDNGIAFSKAGRGIVHQVLTENGFAFPGTLVVASDSHSNMYGGIGCLGTPIVRTDAAAVWATGQTWWTVPKTTRVVLLGELPNGSSGKDVIVALCGAVNKDEVLNQAVEFTGPGVSGLSIDDRLAIANMTTEWGALAGVFPVDEVLIDWLTKRQLWAEDSKFAFEEAKQLFSSEAIDKLVERLEGGGLSPDDNAEYAQTIYLDLSKIDPCVSGPNSVKKMTPAKELEQQRIKIDKAYLISCVNSRASDLHAAAKVFSDANAKVADHVQFYVAPASESVKAESEQTGDWQVLMQAGATALPAGCGPCVGLGAGLLEAGETGISATNRNFKGRMGHPDALCYLASPAVVAQSAISGFIAQPPHGEKRSATASAPEDEPGSFKMPPGALFSIENKAVEGAAPPARQTALLSGFEERLEADLVFATEDNLNTDGIYAGRHTYSELPAEKMAAVAMENYDAAFHQKAKAGDILVGGYNFGSGSSREQAATCLKHMGIALVIAGSFSETYKRNAFNNGLAVLESPALVDFLKRRYKSDTSPTVATGLRATLSFSSSCATLATAEDGEQSFPFSPLSPFAQEILMCGGLEGWVRKRLAASKPEPTAASA